MVKFAEQLLARPACTRMLLYMPSCWFDCCQKVLDNKLSAYYTPLLLLIAHAEGAAVKETL